MADNVVVTAGTGTTVAADEVVDGTLGTVKVQYVKLMDGTLDGTTKAAVGANGLAVAHASGSVASGAFASGAVASGAVASGAFASGSIASGAMVDVGAIADAAVTAGATGSLSAKLRSISRDIALINTALGSTALDLGSGTAGSRTLRMIPDSTAVITKGTAGSPSVDVITMQGAPSMTPVATVGKTVLFDVTLSLDTNIYASGDVLADTQVLTSLFRVSDGTGVLNSIQVIDQDDQKAAFDIYYLSANVTMGTENSAPSISDANAVNVVGPFSIAVADYKDLGGVSVAKLTGLGQAIKADSGTSNGYIAVVNGTGTPTYTASGVKLRLGVLLD